MASGPITTWQIKGEKVDVVTYFLFLGFKITADGDCSHEIKRCLLLGRKAMTNLDSILKNRDITLPTKVYIVKGYSLFTVHVQLWELDCKEGRTPKNWCFQTLVMENTPESPLDSKEIKPVNLKGDQPWIFNGRTDAEAEVQYFGYLIWTDAGKHWG